MNMGGDQMSSRGAEYFLSINLAMKDINALMVSLGLFTPHV